MYSRDTLRNRCFDRDFFQCDILDAAPKDDMSSMEHPIFSLSTKPDTNIRYYEHNGNTLEVIPSVLGLATIWDKDILIYCISQVVEGLNRGRTDINRTIRVTAYDLLVSTNKSTGGKDYKRFQASLKRLAGTILVTNIETNGIRVKEGFALIDKWKIIEKSSRNKQMVAVEITLSEWLYNAALGTEILTMNKAYYRLRKALERRLYELARKHCGKQARWKISLKLLLKKTGSRAQLKIFRSKLKNIVSNDHLPDYRITYNKKTDFITFYNRAENGHQAQIQDVIQGKLL
jgi:plasmid replication initiation protein